MRFLFFTDTHIRGNNPKSRLDDYYLTLKNKFAEIGELIKEHNIDYVLHGGDWFDRPDVSPSIVREFAVLIKDFNVPVYSVAGNHDIYGHNPVTISRTMLGILEATGTVIIIPDGQYVMLEKGRCKVQLYGHSYSYDIDGENYKNSYIVKKNESCDYCINMVHGMLLNKPFIEGVKHTLIEDITSTEADVTLVGHYHPGFGIKKYNEKYCINPGSLARISALKSEISRTPQVVIIDAGEELDITMHNLKSALPGFEVLNREHIEIAQARAYRLNQFIQQAGASGDYDHISIDIGKIIDEIASTEGISQEVKLETIRRIEQSRQNLSKEDID